MKTDKIIIVSSLLFFLLLISSVLYSSETHKHNYKPTAGYVPDEETAIKIAVAVWIPIYGKEQIEKQMPYTATFKNGIWYVKGSPPKPQSGEVIKGGVAEAEIAKDDGKIIRVSHGK